MLLTKSSRSPLPTAGRLPTAGGPPRAGAARRLWWIPAGVVAVTLLAGCEGGGTEEQAAPEGPAFETDAEKASYSLGYRFAENVKRQFGEHVQSESFVEGVADNLQGDEAQVSEEEAQRVLTAMMQEVQSEMETRQAEAASDALENLEKGLAFLEENAQREEVQVTESGLQYEVLEEGEGEKPSPTDVVTTHYEGRLIDGEVFDSSYERSEPAQFPLNRVIPGWTEGLQLMSPGAKYRLYVPSEMAYGEQGRPGIPPNSALIFDVELLDVQSAEEAAAAQPGAAGQGGGDGEAAQSADGGS